METSEGVKTALIQQAEAGVRKLLEQLQTLQGGRSEGTGAAGDGNDLCGGTRVDGEHSE